MKKVLKLITFITISLIEGNLYLLLEEEIPL